MMDMTGREVHVETQHAKHFTGDPTKRAGCREVTVLANRSGGRHGRKHFSQPIDKSTLLVDAHQRLHRKQFPHTVNQSSQLLRSGNVAAKDDDPAGLYLIDQTRASRRRVPCPEDR